MNCRLGLVVGTIFVAATQVTDSFTTLVRTGVLMGRGEATTVFGLSLK
jgi:hypothetical protein